MKKKIGIMLAVLCMAVLALTAVAAGEENIEIRSTVTKDMKYNAATVALSPEAFEAAGFHPGDSCDILFDNGYAIRDVPFYDGYYVKYGAPLIVAYPGYANINITYNSKGIWDTAALTDGTGVILRLNTQGKYLDVQSVLSQVYSFKREDYTSDVIFCNYRTLTGGNLKKNFFYRGTSPVDNSRGRAAYTDALIANEGIGMVMDLADNMEDMAGYMADEAYASPYVADLYDRDRVALVALGPAFQSAEYRQKLIAGLQKMIRTEGPVYIHCMEGKDRTGFVCALLEALAGATYEEMREDYMKTYENYYGVSVEKTPYKYQAISELYFDAFMQCLLGTDEGDLTTGRDYMAGAVQYLLEGGMSEEEIDLLKDYITE